MYNPQLETFLRVADAGSFSKAAAEAFITPTAVIKQMNLLEADLQVKLFERTHRGLTLTKAGQSIYRDAAYIIGYCKDSVARARDAMQEQESTIRIGTSPMTPAQFLMGLWPKIHALCPDIKFQLVPYENSLEGAREILKNLGKNIDVVAGVFDDAMLSLRGCAGFEFSREPICCAVSVQHRLAEKAVLTPADLHGETLMLMHRGWSNYVDELRDDLLQNHPQIKIQDFNIYSLAVFNHCERGNDVLMVVRRWESIHPLLKILPVEWDYKIPYGLLHSPAPSKTVQRFLSAIQTVRESNAEL